MPAPHEVETVGPVAVCSTSGFMIRRVWELGLRAYGSSSYSFGIVKAHADLEHRGFNQSLRGTLPLRCRLFLVALVRFVPLLAARPGGCSSTEAHVVQGQGLGLNEGTRNPPRLRPQPQNPAFQTRCTSRRTREKKCGNPRPQTPLNSLQAPKPTSLSLYKR